MRPPSSERKLQGEWAEVCFLWRAASLGFAVSKPYGDSTRYDFVVDADAGLQRVQVKSVSQMDNKLSYRVSCGSGGGTKRGYTSGDIDFLAAYIIPHDA